MMIESIFNSTVCDIKEIWSKKLKKNKENRVDISFYIESKWEGVVLEVNEDKVFSKMKDVMTGEDYEFDFEMKDVEKDDRELVVSGALFNFYIGYSRNGKIRKNDRLIKFRRQITARNRINSILDKMRKWNLNELIEIQ